MRTRISSFITLVALALVPGLILALVAFGKGEYLLSVGPAFWRGAHAGERNLLWGNAVDAVMMLRHAHISDYSMTDEFGRDDSLHQRTIEIAWPIRPTRDSRYILSLSTERIENCTIIAKTDKGALCVRQ